MKLVMVRHMTTELNARGVLQGRRDVPILEPTPSDLAQIQANLARIRAEGPYDQVLTSSLKRTRMTADLYGYASEVDPLVDELDFGFYEGRPKKELLAQEPLWTDRPDLLVLGEPLSDLEQRIAAFCSKYEASARVLVFGHGAWIRGMVSHIRSGSIQKMNHMDVPNNDVIILDIQKGGIEWRSLP